jgi:3-oxoacyl-[acyl-carrier protein] reductase
MEQRILVTGARRGIGAALAIGLARPGATLVLHHLDAAAETEGVAVRLLASAGSEALTGQVLEVGGGLVLR